MVPMLTRISAAPMMKYCGTSQNTLMGTGALLSSRPSACTCRGAGARVASLGFFFPGVFHTWLVLTNFPAQGPGKIICKCSAAVQLCSLPKSHMVRNISNGASNALPGCSKSHVFICRDTAVANMDWVHAFCRRTTSTTAAATIEKMDTCQRSNTWASCRRLVGGA